MNKKELQELRGNKIAMIFQGPMTSLDPLFTVEYQLNESLKKHTNLDAVARKARMIELLTLVGINQPERRIKQYPYEFSGGMRQRVMIAMALACEPKLLIADEPTTALDVTIQEQILHLIRDLNRRLGMSVLFITHDMGVVSSFATVLRSCTLDRWSRRQRQRNSLSIRATLIPKGFLPVYRIFG